MRDELTCVVDLEGAVVGIVCLDASRADGYCLTADHAPCAMPPKSASPVMLVPSTLPL